MLRKSKQREAIKAFLKTRHDHPTADVVYDELRKEIPNISLGTVYRNLTLLSDTGEILRLNLGDHVDHFDATTTPHYHFICHRCGCVKDLDMDIMDAMCEEARKNFGGEIQGHVAYFYGVCEECSVKS